MKHFEDILPKPDQIAIVDQKQVDYEKKFLGTTKKHPGHTFWEINCSTGEIVPAEFLDPKIVVVPKICLITGAHTGTETTIRQEVNCKENCLYIAALNKKSAGKKYLNWLIEQGIKRKPQ